MLACGFVLEFDFHLPLDEDAVFGRWLAEPQDLPSEFDEAFFLRAIGEAPPQGRARLSGWLHFRSTQVPGQRPLAVADLTFGDLDERTLPTRRARRRRRATLNTLLRTPVMRKRSAAVSWVAVKELPTNTGEMSQLFARALDQLNDFLLALGVAADRRLGPLRRSDLAAVIPCLFASADSSGEWEYAPPQPFLLRTEPDTQPPYVDTDLRRARRLYEVITDEEAFATFYELVQRGNAALAADRGREAVIDFSSAGEIFVTEVVRQAGQHIGMDSAKLSRILTGDFKSRAAIHLGRLIGAPTDPSVEDSITRLWWMHCYLRRNAVVHEGADVDAVLAEVARIGLVSLVVDVREALRAHPVLHELASLVQWGWRRDDTGELSSYPDEID